jgi:hypothetical protein
LSVLSYYPLLFWSLMGMETGLLTMLLLFGILQAFEFIRNKNSTPLFLVSGSLGFAFLSRNDSIIVAFLIFIYIIWETLLNESRSERKLLPKIFASIGMYFVFIIGQLTFQYFYYGEFLPNTYTLKLTGMPISARIINGIGFITPYSKATALLLILACIEVALDFSKKKLLFISIAASALGYQVFIGGDPWNYWRMISPATPLLILLFLNLTIVLIKAFANTITFKHIFIRKPIIQERRIHHILIVILVMIVMRNANKGFILELLLLEKPYTATANQSKVNTALAINQITKNDATIGVFWAGSIPFFTDRKAIDFLGKSDSYIAHLPPDVSGKVSWNGMNSVPGHNKYDLNHSIKILKPTFVQDLKWGAQDLTEWGKTQYVYADYHGIKLYLLKDSPLVLWDKVTLP